MSCFRDILLILCQDFLSPYMLLFISRIKITFFKLLSIFSKIDA